MKTLRYKFGLLLSLAAMAIISSCSDGKVMSQDEYNGMLDGGDKTPKVYFSNEAPSQVDIALDSESFDIQMNRTEAGPAASYYVTVKADEAANEIFEFPAKVDFAKDAKTANYTVKIKEGAVLEYAVMHEITLSIAEKASTPYGDSSYTFQVGVPAPWSEWTKYEHPTGTFTLSLYFSGAFPEVPVMYREYQLDNTKAQFMFKLSVYGGFDLIVDYDKNTNNCQVAPQFATTNSNYGQVTVSDMPQCPVAAGTTYEEFPCTYDPEKGLFTLSLIYFVHTDYNASASGYFAYGVETFQLDGFKQYDYSMNLEFKGHYVDGEGNDNAVISATKGKDVTKYLMTLVSEDADIEATIAAMLDGTLACDELTESGFMAYPVTESGNYVAIAVPFDIDEKPLAAQTIGFEFFKVGEENPWVSLGMATYVEDCMTTFFNVENLAYQVEVRENKDQPGLFRIINPYGAAYPYNSEGDFDASKEYYIEIDATDPEGVYIPGVYGTGMNWGYGEVSISSLAYYYMANQGVPFQDVKDAGYCGIYADNTITFPAGALLISMADYQNGGFFKSNVNGAFVLDMNDMQPAGSAPAKSPAARFERTPKNLDGGIMLGLHGKKIKAEDFLTLKVF